MIFLIILNYFAHASVFNCTGVACSSCSAGYLYYYTCLSLCPTGYIQSATCVSTGSLTVFNINFFGFTSLIASKIGDFHTPSGISFNDPSQLSPLPTKDRGFYFVTTSKLISNANWILAPDFQISILIKIYGDGTIFLMTSSTTYIKIFTVSGKILISWFLGSTITQGLSSTFLLSSATFSYSTWINVLVVASQSSTLFTILSSGYSISIPNFEFVGQILGMKYYLGDIISGSSFSGFMSIIVAYNSVNVIYQQLNTQTFTSQDCDKDFYYDTNGNCNSCSGACGTWPWCTSSSSCSVCYDTTCSECTGFSYNDCTACSNRNQAPGCALGLECLSGSSTFNCQVCNNPFVLINGLCMLQPYGYNVTNLNAPVININFGNFQQYYGGIFQSGADASTWAPYNNPTSDDPFPVRNRGLCFNGSSYLVTSSNILLSHEFSISYWIYPQNNGWVWVSWNLELFTVHSALIWLYNPTEQVMSYTPFYYENFYTWQFVAFSISFINNSTGITTTYNNLVVSVFSLPSGYFFQDFGGIIRIGPRTRMFLFTLTVWQTGISDFSTQYNVCGIGQSGTCLWNCNLAQYYNSYEGVCQSCDSTCTSGCAIGGTCNQCLYADCANCSNYNTSCVSTLTNPCLPGYTFSSTKQCCNSQCLDCFDSFNYSCISCNGTYLISMICVSACPLGFFVRGNVCVTTLNPFLTITLNQIQDRVIDTQSGIVFSTGNSTGFYTNSTIYDPIPVYQRGYYFSNTSYMTSSNFTLPYNFTMVFWIKQLKRGTILQKGHFSILTTYCNELSISSIASLYFNPIPSQNWLIIAIQLSTNSINRAEFNIIYPDYSGSNESLVSSGFFLDFSSPLIIGSSSGSFQGFLYSFSIYSTIESVQSNSLSICELSNSTNCLWNCSLTSYMTGSNCSPCSSLCTNGCRQGNDCNLCQDNLCSICQNYTSECSACNSGYYWNTSYSNCSQCSLSCLNCSGPLSSNCTACKTNSSLFSGTCTCVNGFYWNGTSCNSCDSTCVTCSGSSNTSCLKCPSNSMLQSNGACQCVNKTYWNGTACAACHLTCLNCSGSAINQCLACPSNSILQSNGTCQCISNTYRNGSYCESCSSTCLNCSGPISTQCLNCPFNSALQLNGTCQCVTHTYWNSTTCAYCNPVCLNCSGPSNTQCLSCPSNSTLQLNGTCQCVTNTYWNGTACALCSSTCLNCTGPSNTECLTCPSNSTLQSNGTCQCITNTFWNGTECAACDSTCLNCSGPLSTDCISCPNNASLNNHSCICNPGFFWNNFQCFPCHNSCKTCTGPNYYECLLCSNFTLEIVCLPQCPIGYFSLNNNCTVIESNGLAVSFSFNNLTGLFQDTENGIYALSGYTDTNYPYLDNSDVVPAFQRGIYFNGNGSFLSLPYQRPEIRIFGIRAYLSLWFNPYSSSGILFSKYNSSNDSIFLIEILNQNLQFTIDINSMNYSLLSSTTLNLKQWNHALISFDNSTIPVLSNTINGILVDYSSSILFPFYDSLPSVILLGKSFFNSSYFNGFLYSFQIYVKQVSPSDLFSKNCNTCSICLLSGQCISSCNLTQYPVSTTQCFNCNKQCVNGCRNSNSCNLCDDINCVSCQNYNNGTCLECASKYEVIDGYCYGCSNTTYYDRESKACQTCPGICVTCESETLCTSCAANSSLDSTGNCVCYLGYYINDSACVRQTFTAYTTVDSNDYITLSFLEPLSQNLSTSDILILINNVSQTFTITPKDPASFVICINFKLDLTGSSHSYLIFMTELVSKSNSLLITKFLSLNLFANNYASTAASISAAKAMATKGLASGLSAALGGSFISFDPTSFFSFLSIAELFSCISLFSFDLDPVLTGFLTSIRVQNSTPNIFKYFIPENDGLQLSKKFIEYGLPTNLILINLGTHFTILAATIAVYLIIKVVKKALPSIALKIKNLLMYFEYGAFLRYFIQTSLDFSINSLVGILNNPFESTIFVIDGIVSSFIIVKNI